MWCGVRDLPSKEHWRLTYRLSGASREGQNILFSEIGGKTRSAEILILELRCSESWDQYVSIVQVTNKIKIFHSQHRLCFSWISCLFPSIVLSVLEIRSQVTRITTLNSWSSCLCRLSAEITGTVPQCLALALPHSCTFLASSLPCPLRLSFNASSRKMTCRGFILCN